ncbi:MAG: SDR family NAD(P)-dependent oxidoreductase [Acidimicrobiales bacterium]
MQVTGHTVVVTGGASGIGAALARRLAQAGAAHVVVADRDLAGATAVADQIPVAVARHVDVGIEASIVELIEATERDQGPIELFCSNAGILAVGGAEVSDEAWRRIMDVNVMAHVLGGPPPRPGRWWRGGGTIAITASAAGLLTQIGSAPYSVTKHAALAFAEWLAITYGDAGLRVSALCPQAVATQMTAGIDGGGVAGVDGMLSADAVADAAWAGLAEDRFLILPHPQVADYARRRAEDHDRWIRGMQRLQSRFGDLT